VTSPSGWARFTREGETQLTPEEKLLRAHFRREGGRRLDHDTRFWLADGAAGIEGTVVDGEVFFAARRRQGRAGQVHRRRGESAASRRTTRTRSPWSRWSATRSSRTSWSARPRSTKLFDPTNTGPACTKKSDRIERPDLDNFSWNELKKIK